MFIQLFLLAFIPSILILILFFFSDKYEKEPLHLLFFCFVCGASLSVPITILQTFFPGLINLSFASVWLTILFKSFILSAFIEELLKYLVVKRVVVRSKHFNEPFDGMIYYVAVAAGFAVYEDFTYILSGSAESFFLGKEIGNMSAFHQKSFYIASLRSLPGHTLFAAISGYFIALGKFKYPDKKQYYYFLALFMGILCHGCFNTIAFTFQEKAVPILVLFLVLLLMFIIFMARRLLKASPFNKPRTLLSESELKALRKSREYSIGNLSMFVVLFILIIMTIMFLYYVNYLINGIFN